MPRNMSVCAVVVTYHPDVSVLGAVIEAIRPQVETVFVVDNGSRDPEVEWLRGKERAGDIALVQCRSNLGIATAHNLGMAECYKSNADYALLLDQDSIPDPGMVRVLLHAHRQLSESGIAVSAVGPRYVDPDEGHPSFFVRFGAFKFVRQYCNPGSCAELIEADFLISSGSLISRAAYEAIGGMDEGLFIDHVDTEWFLRAHARGFRAFGVCDARMAHSLGSRTLRVWLGRWRHVPEHSPLRHYYTFRNSVLLYRRDYAPSCWIRNDVVRLLFMLAYYPLRTPPRLQHLWMMLRGAWDGWRGRAGKLESHTADSRSA